MSIFLSLSYLSIGSYCLFYLSDGLLRFLPFFIFPILIFLIFWASAFSDLSSCTLGSLLAFVLHIEYLLFTFSLCCCSLLFARLVFMMLELLLSLSPGFFWSSVLWIVNSFLVIVFTGIDALVSVWDGVSFNQNCNLLILNCVLLSSFSPNLVACCLGSLRSSWLLNCLSFCLLSSSVSVFRCCHLIELFLHPAHQTCFDSHLIFYLFCFQSNLSLLVLH